MFVRFRSTVFRAATAHFPSFIRKNAGLGQKLGLCSVANGPKEVREYNVPVPWGHIAVKEWGRHDGEPVLCLHGWMDNVNSFEPLVTLLSSDYRFVSFEYSGHGLSSYRPLGCFYGIPEFSTDIVRIVEHLKLDKFHLMGHSLGSVLALFYTGLYPGRVGKIVCMDATNQVALTLSEQISRFGKAIQVGIQHETNRMKPPRSVVREEALDIMMKSGLAKVSADVLLKRGCRFLEDSGSFVWNRDPRLYDRMFTLFDSELTLSVIKSCKKDLLLFFATNSVHKTAQDPNGSCREAFAKNSNNYKLVVVEGKHHAHIESPELFAPYINEFL